MDHATQVRILRELFRQLDSDVNVDAGEQLRNPTRVYTHPDITVKEWQQLFRGHPQLVGLICTFSTSIRCKIETSCEPLLR
jgi:hypothetical protein